MNVSDIGSSEIIDSKIKCFLKKLYKIKYKDKGKVSFKASAAFFYYHGRLQPFPITITPGPYTKYLGTALKINRKYMFYLTFDISTMHHLY